MSSEETAKEGATQAVSHRFVETNGLKMHLAEQGMGPLVLLCHGFPEFWYSWRYQMSALAAAGYHVVAPDQRGYGQTERPDAVESYTLLHLVGDLVGLLDALEEQQAVIVGHDWGASVAWHAALLRPDRFRAVDWEPLFLPALFSRTGYCRGRIRARCVRNHAPPTLRSLGRRPSRRSLASHSA